MNASRKPVETLAAGLQPLAVLPVFLKLKGKRAVIAGGNAGAAWKARLLSATGAEVAVFASLPSDEMRAARGNAVDGEIVLHERAWRPEDLAGAAFAIAALDDEADCAAFVAAARAAGVVVNAVDRPQLCDLQFGAIVNRSPLVVGISTEGAAPIFGQAIRSRIEALLPKGFARWVEAAKSWRERVSASFASSLDRRLFWERFADRAMAQPARVPGDDDFADLMAAVRGGGEGGRGSVTLVGAGPGDPELLTLKAVRALRAADVILYDDLVAPEILDYARREAKTMLVGKTGHGPSCKQDEINGLMVRLAGEGKRVVRLKSGDPMVFGRAGEEIEACRSAEIPVEIIPGVTAAQGASARIGASLTHRALARRVQFITGHDRNGALPNDLDWGAIVDPAATTAIYMPRRTLEELLATAMAKGLSPQTPAVAFFNVTRADEHIERATAASLAERVGSSRSRGPLLVLIGRALDAAWSHPITASDQGAPAPVEPEAQEARRSLARRPG